MDGKIKTADNETLFCDRLKHIRFKNSSHHALFTIIHFYGNARSIDACFVVHQQLLSAVKYRVFLVGYRDFGQSSWKPSGAGLKLDAQAALEWTLDRLSE